MIPLFKPAFDEREFRAVREVLKSGWIGLGPKTEEFEKTFASFLGVKYAVGLNSGTAALHLALKMCDIKDREVITTPLTFIATNHSILYNGGIPVFCDIEEDTLNINADKIEDLITERTKAILIVHLAGHPCDMDKITAIAKKHKLKLVEDCAHAVGAEYKGVKAGTFGDFACFSFHPTKNIACGDGGAIVTNSEKDYRKLIKLRWLGINKEIKTKKKCYYEIEELGYKYHMNDIMAALCIEQMNKLEDMQNKRREIVRFYNKTFKKIKGVKCMVKKDYTTVHAHHLYIIKVSEEKCDGLISYLEEKGIASGKHYYPNHLYDFYKQYYRNLPTAEKIGREIITLPLFTGLLFSEIKYIAISIREFLEE